MNSQTTKQLIQGPAGSLAIAINEPVTEAVGTALICHPHPLHGGTMDNKVAQTLARAWVQAGWRAVRFNFRGVGESQGRFDDGRGEVADALAVVQALAPTGRLALSGFSFGAFVCSNVARELESRRAIEHVVLIGPATKNFSVAQVPAGTLVVHGEHDDVVPLQATLDWARPQALPIIVVPGGGHFFHGQLALLKNIVLRHLGVRVT